jgi:hypothetical protein
MEIIKPSKGELAAAFHDRTTEQLFGGSMSHAYDRERMRCFALYAHQEVARRVVDGEVKVRNEVAHAAAEAIMLAFTSPGPAMPVYVCGDSGDGVLQRELAVELLWDGLRECFDA